MTTRDPSLTGRCVTADPISPSPRTMALDAMGPLYVGSGVASIHALQSRVHLRRVTATFCASRPNRLQRPARLMIPYGDTAAGRPRPPGSATPRLGSL